MKLEVNERYLITTDQWFVAPNGEQYRAVWGTLRGVINSENALQIRTNARSTNWYVSIGRTVPMLIAGCQIHYVMRCPVLEPPAESIKDNNPIFDADRERFVSLMFPTFVSHPLA